MEHLPDSGNADIENGEWIVNLEHDDTGSKRVTIQALNEMGAIIEAEERFGGTAISAYPKPYHTPRCPICAGLNCKNPHDGRY